MLGRTIHYVESVIRIIIKSTSGKKHKIEEFSGLKTRKLGKRKAVEDHKNKMILSQIVFNEEHTEPLSEGWVQCSQYRKWTNQSCKSYTEVATSWAILAID